MTVTSDLFESKTQVNKKQQLMANHRKLTTCLTKNDLNKPMKKELSLCYVFQKEPVFHFFSIGIIHYAIKNNSEVKSFSNFFETESENQ